MALILVLTPSSCCTWLTSLPSLLHPSPRQRGAAPRMPLASCLCLAKVSSSWSLGAAAEARQEKLEAAKMLRVRQPKGLCPQQVFGEKPEAWWSHRWWDPKGHPTLVPSPCHRLDDISVTTPYPSSWLQLRVEKKGS